MKPYLYDTTEEELKHVNSVRVAMDGTGRKHCLFLRYTDKNGWPNFIPLGLTDEQINSLNNMLTDEKEK